MHIQYDVRERSESFCQSTNNAAGTSQTSHCTVNRLSGLITCLQ